MKWKIVSKTIEPRLQNVLTDLKLLSGCSDSNLGEEICAFLDGITSNYGCTIMGGNTACAATCQSCNSTANLVITSRSDKVVDRYVSHVEVDQFEVRKALEALFRDKQEFAQYVNILDNQIFN